MNGKYLDCELVKGYLWLLLLANVSSINADVSGNSQVIQMESYHSFGDTIGSREPLLPSPKNHYLYNHKELQDERQLYNYGARFDDPVVGRWTVIDPVVGKYER